MGGIQSHTTWVIGDVATDLVLSTPDFPVPGGDAFAERLETSLGGCGANMSITLTKLGIRTALAANVGMDNRGQEALAVLAAQGIDISAVTRDNRHQTHLTVIVVTAGGERTIFGYRGASSNLKATVLSELRRAPVAAIVVSGYALLENTQRYATEEIIKWGSSHGMPVILDVPALIPGAVRNLITQILPQITMLIVGAEEACQLGDSPDVGTALRNLASHGGKVIVTRGAASLLYARGSESLELVPPPVDSIDSTGAGDAFAAALTATQISGLGMADCLRIACAFGATATQTPGAGTGLPGRPEVVKFLANSRDFYATISAAGVRWLNGMHGLQAAD